MNRKIREGILTGMVTVLLFLAMGALLCAAGCSGPKPDPGGNASPGKERADRENNLYNDYALFLAGMKNRTGPLVAYQAKPAWVQHASFFDDAWRSFRERQLVPMRQWASRALSTAASSRLPLFYPFSGPDFVNMYTLFPDSSTYVMIALNPVGEIPDFPSMDEKELDSFFASLRRSLYNLLHLDFFITKDLEVTLRAKELEGVLPVILFFMARQDLRVLDVRYWSMNPEGSVVEAPAMDRTPFRREDVPGLRIRFQSAHGEETRTLYYFRCDLANGPFERKKHFVSLLKGFGRLTTFVKAASYLMFDPGFSAIREFVLDRSLYILQTDSGIPVKDFDPAVWKLELYGTYTGPIPIFKYRYQPDLAELYKKGENVRPLPFGIGYHFRVHTSSLIFASRKGRSPVDDGE